MMGGGGMFRPGPGVDEHCRVAVSDQRCREAAAGGSVTAAAELVGRQGPWQPGGMAMAAMGGGHGRSMGGMGGGMGGGGGGMGRGGAGTLA